METPGQVEDDATASCVICLSAVSERAATVPCGHDCFDFICLVSWLQQRSNCPLCKSQVTAVHYDHASPTDYKTFLVPRTHPPTTRDTHGARCPPQATASSEQAHSRHTSNHSRRSRLQDATVQPDPALLRRRYIYAHNLYSLHIGSNPLSGYRDLTPHEISASSALQSKAKTFVRRDLRVFGFLYNRDEGSDPSLSASTSASATTTSSNAEFLLAYIVAILKKVDLRGSDGHAEELLKEFLGRRNARLFLHELNAWMRSPFTKLREWDDCTEYSDDHGCGAPSTLGNGIAQKT